MSNDPPLDGLPIPGTSISVVAPLFGSRRVFYQAFNGRIRQQVVAYDPSTAQTLTAGALSFSPIASLNWNNGRQARLYYLDNNYVVQEYCFVEDEGWYQGKISAVGARADPSAGLAATVYDNQGNIQIRVYYQEDGSRIIKEIIHNGGPGDVWRAGDLSLAGALAGTSLAAVTYYSQIQIQTRVFYQAQDLYLRDHHRSNRGWLPGDFDPGRTTGKTPLSAIAFGTTPEVQVYWRNISCEVVFSRTIGAWGATTVIPGPGPGYQFSVLQWLGGKSLRFFHQQITGSLTEYCSDDNGQSWYPGATLT